MCVASEFERHRGAATVDVHDGSWREVDRNQYVDAISACFSSEPHQRSADLVSIGEEVRIIEVKGRGSSGPIELPERELDTLRCAGRHAWLYVVWYTTQPQPIELWIVKDPGGLAWHEDFAAQRPLGAARGVQHEARFSINAAAVEEAGELVALPELVLALAWQLKTEAFERGEISHQPL